MIFFTRYYFKFVSFFVFLWIPTLANAQNPIEVGTVKWTRNFDKALELSSTSGKPVFVLFQEVPGCSGCQKFGRNVLSSPLLVEAIEDEFIPVLVYNNKGGKDKALLNRYNEPSWNFQVVRFLDHTGKDIIPRKDRVWDTGGISSRMIEVLEKTNRIVPKYLQAISAENNTRNHLESAFEMYCFWTGEVVLGQIDGVISTEAGWLNGGEVTRVVYQKDKVSLSTLAHHAQKRKCARRVYASKNEVSGLEGFKTGILTNGYSKSKKSDQNKQLQNWPSIKNIDGLTEMQITKINAFSPYDKSKALSWLSPRQRKQLERI